MKTKKIWFAVLLFCPLFSWAQVVSKVEKETVTISLPEGAQWNVGDAVSILDEYLKVAAKGAVSTLSPNKKTVLVRLSEGQVKVGMTAETDAAPSAAKPLVASDGTPLSEDDFLLDSGTISKTRYIVGGVLGTYPIGFGVGHAIQGRYSEKGWIFTAGELSSLAVLIAGLDDCDWDFFDGEDDDDDDCDSGLVALGAAGFITFRIWEIVDVWAAPVSQDSRNRRQRRSSLEWRPVIVASPTKSMVGFQLSF